VTASSFEVIIVMKKQAGQIGTRFSIITKESNEIDLQFSK